MTEHAQTFADFWTFFWGWLFAIQIPAETYGLIGVLMVIWFYHRQILKKPKLRKRFNNLLERTMSVKFLMWFITTVFVWWDNVVWNLNNLKWEWWMTFTFFMAGLNVTQKGVFQYFNKNKGE